MLSPAERLQTCLTARPNDVEIPLGPFSPVKDRIPRDRIVIGHIFLASERIHVGVRMHLHHRLLQIGHSDRRVVLLIYLWTAIVAFGAAGTIFFDPRYTGAVMLGAMLIAIVVTLIPLLRRENSAEDGPYDAQ